MKRHAASAVGSPPAVADVTLRSGDVQAPARSMSEMRVRPLLLIALSASFGAACVLAGCGGKKTVTPATSAAPTTSSATPAPPSTAATGATTPSASALQAEATSAATGDIP